MTILSLTTCVSFRLIAVNQLGSLAGAILVEECDKLIGPERVEAVGVAGLVTKLDLEGSVGEHLNHRANLTGNQTQLGQVADKRHGVEQLDV